MKPPIFNALLMVSAVVAAYLTMRPLPSRHPLPGTALPLEVQKVDLGAAAGPLRLAGAWELSARDRRFTGLSALAIEGGRFLAVTDRGAVVRFDYPTANRPEAQLSDLRDGPGEFGRKFARDAESLARDPAGRGWWVGYEQNHSLWLYDDDFTGAVTSLPLDRDDWRDNRGAEGLLAEGGRLLVTAENGREVVEVGAGFRRTVPIDAGADIADASRAPNGDSWLLLRSKGLDGVTQSIAPLIRTATGYRAGHGWPVPKGPFDNYEGLAIEPRPGGGWRFWLVSDDGHRIFARTLLVALDYWPLPNDKGPATSTGPSKNQKVGGLRQPRP